MTTAKDAFSISAREWADDFQIFERGTRSGLIEIETAKKWHAAYRKAQNSNLLRKQEIKRLRPYEKVAADLAACGSYVGIGPGEGELPIPERVRRCVNRLKETQHEYEQKIISKDARIKELEADNQNLVTMNKALMKNDWILRDNNRKYRKRAQKAELLNKSLKSKIGPDAKPRS